MDSHDFGEFMTQYDTLKRHIRGKNPHLYERWKAGGFLVDSSIVSMYPSLEEVMEEIGFENDLNEDEGDEDGE